MPVLRPLSPQDAAPLADLLQRNREHLAPWEPIRPESYFTRAGQLADIAHVLERQRRGECAQFTIRTGSGEVIGRLSLNSIIRGAFQSCSIGYWVDEAHTGQGVATAATAEALAVAFGPLRLHRVQAEVMPENHASRAVILKSGFTQYGHAPSYLKIAGSWRDFDLFQALA